MRSKQQKDLIKRELKENLRRVYWHFKFSFFLMKKYFKRDVTRNPSAVEEEYQAGWQDYFHTRKYFEPNDYLFIENNQLIKPMISPFDYQRDVTNKWLAEYIRKYDFKSILEVGSGGGLNLIHLATQFPDVKFYGLELTRSGVETSREILRNPPLQFNLATGQKKIENVEIFHGSILEPETIQSLKGFNFDLVFTCAVLEQLHNYLDIVFSHISQLNYTHFLFNEEWLDLNSDLKRYRVLLEHDYFRAPIDILNRFPMRVRETLMPSRQPMGMNLAMVFGENTNQFNSFQTT